MNGGGKNRQTPQCCAIRLLRQYFRPACLTSMILHQSRHLEYLPMEEALRDRIWEIFNCKSFTPIIDNCRVGGGASLEGQELRVALKIGSSSMSLFFVALAINGFIKEKNGASH